MLGLVMELNIFLGLFPENVNFYNDGVTYLLTTGTLVCPPVDLRDSPRPTIYNIYFEDLNRVKESSL